MERPPDLDTDPYLQAIAAGLLQDDLAQHAAVAALRGLLRVSTGLSFLFRRMPPSKGIYLHAPPGRGKSVLADLYFNAARGRKLRFAHHEFMRSVHAAMKAARALGEQDPIDAAVPVLLREGGLLYIDEFEISDIADAMILQRLLTALQRARVRLLITSNRAPDDLYADGLNRELFLPAIALLHLLCRSIPILGAVDYRLQSLRGRRTAFTPADPEALHALRTLLAPAPQPQPLTLEVGGRSVVFDDRAGCTLQASFQALCCRPLGSADYAALADTVSALFIERIPVMTEADRNAAIRFRRLIDIWYERGHFLAYGADAAPEALYVGHNGAFEFERTGSRLHQMRSQEYIERFLSSCSQYRNAF